MNLGVDAKTRRIYLIDEITQESARNTLMALHYLRSLSNEKVTLWLCTQGGDVGPGLMLYDAIRREPPGTIEIIGSGEISSMGAILLQAAYRRVITPSTTLMFHGPQVSIETDSTSLMRWAHNAEAQRKQFATILAERSKPTTVRTWMERLRNDYVLTADEALAAGVVDEVRNIIWS